MLDEEAVVTERRLNLAVDRSRNFSAELTHLARREHDVRFKANHYRTGFYALERVFEASASTPHVMGVERVENCIIGICIEAPA